MLRGFRNVLVDFVSDLRTGREGEEPRLQVDQGSTGFYAGREFRTVWDCTGDGAVGDPTTGSVLSGNTERIIKVVAPTDLILLSLEITAYTGELRVQTLIPTGGTEGGTFDTSLPIIPANTMSSVPSPAYEAQTTITTGGTFDGNASIDVFKLQASLSPPAKENPVGSTFGGERGVGSGTYYFRLEAMTADDVQFILRSRFEERPSGV